MRREPSAYERFPPANRPPSCKPENSYSEAAQAPTCGWFAAPCLHFAARAAFIQLAELGHGALHFADEAAVVEVRLAHDLLYMPVQVLAVVGGQVLCGHHHD